MEPTEPITIRASKDVVSQIDALATSMDRSRNYVVIRPSSNTSPITTFYTRK